MLRHLSTLLADKSLAVGDSESLEEILQLVAEQVREMTDARCGSVTLAAGPVSGLRSTRDESPTATILGRSSPASGVKSARNRE
jgi:hypothetical protein